MINLIYCYSNSILAMEHTKSIIFGSMPMYNNFFIKVKEILKRFCFLVNYVIIVIGFQSVTLCNVLRSPIQGLIMLTLA